MKNFCLAILWFFFSFVAAANGLLNRAYEQYSQRDYNPAGLQNAKNSRYNYNLVTSKFVSVKGEYARARAFQATLFILSATSDERAYYTQEGFSQAYQSSFFFERAYGRNPFQSAQLDTHGKKIYADVLYWGGRISAEWLKDQNGSMTNEWKILKDNIGRVIANGYGCLNDGGAYAFLNSWAEAYQCASWNGFNVLSYANQLKAAGQDAQAIQVLKIFLTKKPEDLSLGLLPENRQHQKLAIEKLKQWGALRASDQVPGEYIIKLSRRHLQQMGLMGKHTRSWLTTRLKTFVKDVIDSDLVVVRRPLFEDPQNSLNWFLQNPLVEIVEPNYIYRLSNWRTIPKDPSFGLQWGLENSGQADPGGVSGLHGTDINILKAWPITQGRSEIVVGIIDTGIDFLHQDLKDNIWSNSAEANGQFGVDDDQNGYVDDIYGWDFIANQPLKGDDHGHGTHCAGIIGASANTIGVVGINWKVRLMGLRFIGAIGGGSLDAAIKAIRYASHMGVRITNNSWGGADNSEILKQVIMEAGDNGMLFVAAAGNNGENVDVLPEFPAAFPLPNVISVAALNNRGELANFSNYGEQSVHIAAPGQNILSTTPDNHYQSFSGTSMAAPFVTGVAALILSKENLPVSDLKNRILKSASTMGNLRGKVKTAGRLNTYAAITASTPLPDPYDPFDWNSQSLNFSTSHSYFDNQSVEFEVDVPAARYLSIFTPRFNIEENYDRVFFMNSQKQVVGMWTGNHSGQFSPLVEGHKMFVRFESDSHLTDYGFDINKVSFIQGGSQ